MIRILVPRGVYNEHRIALLERLTMFQIKRFILPQFARHTSFLEGFLESEDKLLVAGERLSDHYQLIPVKVDTMPTWIIDEDYVSTYSDGVD